MKTLKKYILFVFLTSMMLEGIAQTHLTVQDTRSVSSTPSSYSSSFEAHFKYGSAVGLSESNGNTFYGLLGLRAWTNDNSGGKAHELAFANDGQILFRSGYSPTWENWRKLIIADENENVGIGTTDTKGYRLAVNGKIRTHEIKVETANWPDYVFAKDYQLPTLQETEKHIKENGHLPGIPSAEEVKTNGIDLGEMNAKLLQKIEELTLHLINQQKEIELLKKRK
uniref:hypothetical protein n=1 Tax=Pedobacter schmidteae TaxID=2201271 RepID=UPI0018D53404|nr:hypothetical protein [Pedobacter schmidteae]